LREFFLGYRKTALKPGEFMQHIDIPAFAKGTRAAAYKVSKRRELDISAVSAGMLVVVDGNGVVTEARLGFGGMAATPARAALTEKALVGQPWTEATVERISPTLEQDFKPLSDLRGSAWYRATVARNLLLGFYLETVNDPLPALPQRPTATVHLDGERA
jgi:xanthine dehydrogenase iron-sulfur cluster and FAD-binding subunit A